MVTVAVFPLPLHHLSLDLWHYEGKEEDDKERKREGRREEFGEVVKKRSEFKKRGIKNEWRK